MQSLPTPSMSWSKLNPEVMSFIPTRSSRASGPSCERSTSSIPFVSINFLVASGPNIVPMPRLSLKIIPSTSTPGSDHSTSPAICVSPSPSGSSPPFHALASSLSVPTWTAPFFPLAFFFDRQRPPCSTSVFDATCAASGSSDATRMNSRHSARPSFVPYLTSSSFLYPYTSVQNSHSWLPLVSVTNCGEQTFHAKTSATSSAPHAPLSTKSPLNTYQFVSLGSPARCMRRRASWNCPCVSPTTFTRTSGDDGVTCTRVPSPSSTASVAFRSFSMTDFGTSLRRFAGWSGPVWVLASMVDARFVTHSFVSSPPLGQVMAADDFLVIVLFSPRNDRLWANRRACRRRFDRADRSMDTAVGGACTRTVADDV